MRQFPEEELSEMASCGRGRRRASKYTLSESGETWLPVADAMAKTAYWRFEADVVLLGGGGSV